MNDVNDMIAMTVAGRRALTPSIVEFTLAPADGATLPDYGPGAHVSVRTPSGAMRRYSLVRSGRSPRRYVIAVKREPDSRGGSLSMHDAAVEGTGLLIEPPQNDFPLGRADRYLLIAGGIGITPIYAMAQELARENKTFDMIYCTRSAEETAYLADMTEQFGDNLLIHHDGGDPDRVYDFWDHFAEPLPMHVYCCGPRPLMEEIKAISGHWPEGRVNFEDFKPVEIIRANDAAFDVELAKTGKTVHVPADRTILEAIRDDGVATVSSCESGTCGTCKTKLIAGDVDHRDMVLMEEEKAGQIMICISRARSGNLVIDL